MIPECHNEKEYPMIKKIIAILLCGMMIFGVVGCTDKNGDNENTDDATNSDTTKPDADTEDTEDNGGNNGGDNGGTVFPDVELTTTQLTSATAGIKILGERQYVSDEEEQINCDWTCSGIEFVLNSYGGDVSFEAESDKPCYFRAYINGEEWMSIGSSPYFVVDGKSTISLKKVPTGDITVRLIKVSGHTLARAQLYSVSYYGTLKETAPADKELYIEFIGDSISCGWGVVGNHDGTYASQDGTYAYPYLLSQELNADYSVTALSGQGLLYHGTNMPNMINGYLLSSPLRNVTAMYGFERKADVVVINIGTNDYSHRSSITADEFAEAYKQLIEIIKEKNGADCKIVCLYDTMNDTFAQSIISVCYKLGGNANGIYTFRLERAASGHPTIEENVEYTAALKTLLQDVIDGKILETKNELDTEASGDGMSVDISQFYPIPNDR